MIKNLIFAITTNASTNPKLNRFNQDRSAVVGKTINCKFKTSNEQNALLANHQSALENKVVSKLPATTRANHGWIGVRIDLVVILTAPPYRALIVRAAVTYR